MGAGDGQKSAKFWAPHPSGPKRMLVLPCFFVVLSFFEKKENTETVKLAKVGWPKSATPILAKVGQLRLAKVGQFFLAKVGLAKVGQIRMAKVGLSRLAAHASHVWQRGRQ